MNVYVYMSLQYVVHVFVDGQIYTTLVSSVALFLQCSIRTFTKLLSFWTTQTILFAM